MTQNNQPEITTNSEISPREQFEREVGQIGFNELQKHFAKGIMIQVAETLDLIEVALQIHADNADQIQQWLDGEKLVRAHDEHAKKWIAERAEFKAVTVAPWVLVQEIV